MAVEITTRATTPAIDAARPRRVAFVALAIGAVYVLWRLTTLGSGSLLLVSIPVLLLEVWALVDLAAFAYRSWRLPSAGEPRPDSTARADVVVDANRGSVADLERTLVALTTVPGCGVVTVVDAHDRPAVHELIARFGGRLDVGSVAAAGVDTIVPGGTNPVWVWLSAGQVPMPQLISSAAPRFDAPRVAVCEVGADLINDDSLVHLRGGRDEAALRRRVTGPAMGARGLAPWTGPGSIVRRAALDDVGGFVGQLDDAPHLTAMRLQASGWSTEWDARPLVRQSAPDTLDEYLEDRHDRGSAFVRTLRSSDGPLRARTVPARVRVMHLASALAFGRGVRLAAAVAMLMVSMTFGVVPVDTELSTFVLVWSGVSLAAAVGRAELARGEFSWGDWVRNGWRTLEADARALRAAPHRPRHELHVVERRQGFMLLGRLRLVTGLLIGLQMAVLARSATAIAGTGLPALTTGARLAMFALAAGLSLPMLDVLQVMVRRRQRRRHNRVPADFSIDVDGASARTIDLSPRGVGVSMEFAPAIATVLPYRLHLVDDAGDAIVVAGEGAVRSAAPGSDGRVRVGLEFGAMGDDEREALIHYCALDRAAIADDGRQHPDVFTVARGPRAHLGLRLLVVATTLAAVLALVTGSADAQLTVPALVEEICVVRADGTPFEGADVVAVDRADGSSVETRGITGSDGCVATAIDTDQDRPGVAFEGAMSDVVRRVDGGAVWFAEQTYAVQVLGADGRGIADAQVRGYRDGWGSLGATDGDGVVRYDALAPFAAIDATARDLRLAGEGAEPVAILAAAAVVDDPANPIVAVSANASWQPAAAGESMSPGPTTLRHADGTIVRVDLRPGEALDLRTGVAQPIPVVTPPPVVSTSTVPASTVPASTVPASTVPATSVPTTLPATTVPAATVSTTSTPPTSSVTTTAPGATAPSPSVSPTTPTPSEPVSSEPSTTPTVSETPTPTTTEAAATPPPDAGANP